MRTASIEITVNPVNDAPGFVFAPSPSIVLEAASDEPTLVPLVDLVFDIEDDVETLEIDLASSGEDTTYGSAEVADNAVVFNPKTSAIAQELSRKELNVEVEFFVTSVIQVTDSEGETSTAKLTWRVSGLGRKESISKEVRGSSKASA